MSGSIRSGRNSAREGLGVVLQVGQLDPPGDLVALAPNDVIGVGLALAVGQALHGCEDSLVETFSPQILGRDRSILDHVMEDGHDLRRFTLHGVHDPERVEDVRLAVLVLLPLVGSGGDLQRFLDGRHDFPRYETRSDPQRFGLVVSLDRP